MVDVSEKNSTKRSATAQGRLYIPKIAYDLVSDSSRAPEPSAPASPDTEPDLERRKEKSQSKGDVLSVAQLAGIMASKRTADLIPLCHSLPLSHVSVRLSVESAKAASQSRVLCPTTQVPERGNSDCSRDKSTYSIVCSATVTCEGKTGVEMEALTAVSVSLLTAWDMLKAVAGREMVMSDIYVVRKAGGKTGDFSRTQAPSS